MSAPEETPQAPAQEPAKPYEVGSAGPFSGPVVDMRGPGGRVNPDDPPVAGDTGDKPAEPDWKSEARKWEARAKENRAAADKLAELERAQMTEAERAAEKLREAEQRTADLTARAARLELALDYRLTPEDATLLEGVTDPDALKRLAERLAVKADESRGPRPDPNQGRQTRGPATPADLFAAAIEQQFR